MSHWVCILVSWRVCNARRWRPSWQPRSRGQPQRRSSRGGCRCARTARTAPAVRSSVGGSRRRIVGLQVPRLQPDLAALTGPPRAGLHLRGKLLDQAAAARDLGVPHHAINVSARVAASKAPGTCRTQCLLQSPAGLAAPFQGCGDPVSRQLPRLVPGTGPVTRPRSEPRVPAGIGGQGMSPSAAVTRRAF
jgi:hypothetical protein